MKTKEVRKITRAELDEEELKTVSGGHGISFGETAPGQSLTITENATVTQTPLGGQQETVGNVVRK